jgi:hypothetical protein
MSVFFYSNAFSFPIFIFGKNANEIGKNGQFLEDKVSKFGPRMDLKIHRFCFQFCGLHVSSNPSPGGREGQQ